MSLTLLPVLGAIFIVLGCLIQSFYKVMCLVLLHLMVSHLGDINVGLLFSERKQRSSTFRERRGREGL